MSANSLVSMVLLRLSGPRLYQRYIRSTHGLITKHYEPNNLEYYCDIYFKCLRVAGVAIKSTYPLGLFYLFRSKLWNDPIGLLKYSFGPIAHLFLLSLVMSVLRGIGRSMNPDYNEFAAKLTNLTMCKNDEDGENLRKTLMTQFDFDISRSFPSRHVGPLFKIKELVAISASTNSIFVRNIQRIFYRLVSYIIYPVAIRITYPGSTSLVSLSLHRYILDGRSRQITEFNGQREILRISDREGIDTMFFDRRRLYPEMGSKLLICCEGNAGYYEIGSLNTALKTNYSLLGWNHPGFASSTAGISLLNEQYAVQAVMSYATDILQFREEDIYVYGWSIGGYSAAFLAANYPGIGGIVMDAVFDKVTPLAIQQFQILAPFIEYTMNSHINLDNVPLLQKYNGPIKFIRRLGDEIVTVTPGKLTGNLINNLIIETLSYRYPEIFIDEALSSARYFLSIECSLKKDDYHREMVDDKSACLNMFRHYTKIHRGFPCTFGADLTMDDKKSLAVFLVGKYLFDYNSGHCDTLHISLLNALPSPID